MKQSNNILVFIIFLFSLSAYLLYASNSGQFSESDNKGFQIKSSEYWNLKGTPIFINNSDPLYNWNKTAAENEWCSGSGTWGDPFRIENVTIDGLGKGFCIAIINSYVPFEIKNCVLYNAFSGIYLENVHNSSLIDNTCFNNSRGIMCYEVCKNISIGRNKLYGNYAGLSVYYNILTYIVNNKIFENTEYGIELISSINTIIEENEISKNYGENGAILDVECENSTYIGNTIQDNLGGILIEGSSNILVFRNLFLKNTRWGLNATFCELENLAYLNCFVSNGINAQDKGLSFNWDNGSVGNYWDDYTGIDSDENGIGDTPYYIQGLPDVPDNYPLMSCPFYSSKNKIISGYNEFTMIIFSVIFLLISIIYLKKKHLSF